MRPIRLELEGFAAFRDHTVISFEDTDLFALVGPTGAGKTTVIDGITFALYGSVPRLADQRAVAPVLAQGGVEAKVRLDFTVAGRHHSLVRVVRATRSGGATTREARLESGGQTLASDADQVTAAVGELLGLDFVQFTTCVSLPQGEFARFLHDRPRERQDLLVRLLDLGIYDLVASRARQRAEVADERVRLAAARLDRLSGATAESVAAAEARVAELEALRELLDRTQDELDALADAAGSAEREAEALAASMQRLDAIVMPEQVAQLSGQVAAANAAYEAARADAADAAEAVAKAEARLVAMPQRTQLERIEHDRAELEQLAGRLESCSVALDQALAAEGAAREVLERAESGCAAATSELEAARTADIARTLASQLVLGEPCPVCQQPVTALHRSAPPQVAAAEKALKAAEKRLAKARSEHSEMKVSRARAEQQLAGLAQQHDALGASLANAPDPDALDSLLAEIDEATAELARAKTREGRARKGRDSAEHAVANARRAEDEARASFDAVRDSVAALGPPPTARGDLAGDWEALVSWAAASRPELKAQLAAATGSADEHRRKLHRRRSELEATCRSAGLEIGDRPRDSAVQELARAEAELRRLEAEVEEAAELRAAADESRAEAAVSRALAEHLAANRFERWLLDAVLQQLVEVATVLLRELSGGAYSLVLEERRSRAFAVVDHVNAGAVRSARTLSGGETFLVSLALALALADQVALLAGSTARLETILLDEGFGTLDAETLDVVAGALEELGARGRMVGIVTHVRELAERMPVRYEVTKVGGASRVERLVV